MLLLQPSESNDEKYQYRIQKILHDKVNIRKEANVLIRHIANCTHQITLHQNLPLSQPFVWVESLWLY